MTPLFSDDLTLKKAVNLCLQELRSLNFNLSRFLCTDSIKKNLKDNGDVILWGWRLKG